MGANGLDGTAPSFGPPLGPDGRQRAVLGQGLAHLLNPGQPVLARLLGLDLVQAAGDAVLELGRQGRGVQDVILVGGVLVASLDVDQFADLEQPVATDDEVDAALQILGHRAQAAPTAFRFAVGHREVDRVENND